jgi:hypothetical protein
MRLLQQFHASADIHLHPALDIFQLCVQCFLCGDKYFQFLLYWCSIVLKLCYYYYYYYYYYFIFFSGISYHYEKSFLFANTSRLVLGPTLSVPDLGTGAFSNDKGAGAGSWPRTSI